jgi:hypothetical protein
MAVDQAADLLFAQHAHHFGGIHIHDFGALAGLGRFAAGARLACQALAQGEGKAPQQRPRQRMAHAAAKRLVGGVVGAQRVAMHQQRRRAVQVDAGGVGQQRHAGRAA